MWVSIKFKRSFLRLKITVLCYCSPGRELKHQLDTSLSLLQSPVRSLTGGKANTPHYHKLSWSELHWEMTKSEQNLLKFRAHFMFLAIQMDYLVCLTNEENQWKSQNSTHFCKYLTEFGDCHYTGRVVPTCSRNSYYCLSLIL